MGLVYYVVLEISRVGDFYIPPRSYGIVNVTSPQAPFLAFGGVDPDYRGRLVEIPVYVNENEDQQIGVLKFSFNSLTLTLQDQFEFTIDSTHSISVRIIKTKSMKGTIRKETPIPIPEQAIIGHRGYGANDFTSTYLENSISSYKAALQAGANAIELDVQLTSDDIPVCNHNFEVEDRDNNCREFVRINTIVSQQFRKSGLCTPFEIERPTLREVLNKVPQKAILDIELKFPTDQNSFPYTDRNHFINRIIRECEEYGTDRQIFFCTFDLMIAVMIGFKQKKYPVFLLAGLQEDQPISLLVNQVRAITPLLKFARVRGFIFNSPNLMAAPGLVKEVTQSGFIVMSWGTENLKEEGINAQIKAGVSGFVTDDIGLTRLLIAKFVNSETEKDQ